jgi:diguanylate cyclase (GGDEF)-like protein
VVSRGELETGADRARRAAAEEPGGYRTLFELAIALRTRFERSREAADLDESISMIRQALRVASSGEGDRWVMTSQLSATLRTRFEGSGNVEDLEEAVAFARQALREAGPGNVGLPAILSNLATTLTARSEFIGDISSLDEAISIIRQALSLLPEGHGDRAAILSNLAATLRSRAERAGGTDLSEAISVARAALNEIPVWQPLRTKAQSTLARSLHLSGQLDAAEAELRSVLATRTVALGPDHPETLATAQLIAGVLHDQGRTDEAEAQLRKVLAARRQALGADHPDTLAIRHQLAVVSRDQGYPAEAAAELRGLLFEARRILGENHPDTVATQRMLEVADKEANLAPMAGQAVAEADRDPLTAVLTRTAFLTEGAQSSRTLPDDHEVTLIVIDLDGFRVVNDTLGHRTGDEILRVVAERIAAVAKSHELVGRLGSDEFGLILIGPTEAATTTAHSSRLAREIIESIARPIELADHLVAVDASVALANAAPREADLHELLRRAGIAMHRAKTSVGEVVRYDSAADRTASPDSLVLLGEMRQALASPEQLELAFQPVIEMASGRPIGVEAFVRWRHPRRGYLGPNVFLPIVEDGQMAGPLTRHVVDLALREATRWATEDGGLPVAVNVSARALADPRLPDDIAILLRRHRMPPAKLILEIAEDALLPYEQTTATLMTLRRLGVRISIDNFGIGYSSLGFLARVPAEELKIDRSFVHGIGYDPTADRLVGTIIQLAQALGLRTVAEGVETPQQAARLAALGCDAAQGYFYTMPLSKDDIVKVLGSQLAPTGEAST